jgi:hypothetical protein
MALQSILLMSMPTTPNRRPLRFAVEEIYVIDNFVPHSIKRMILPSPIKSEVLNSEVLRESGNVLLLISHVMVK